MKFLSTVTASALLTLAATFYFAPSLLNTCVAEEAALTRSISVSGLGEVSAKPDQASITVGVTTQAKEASAALADNTQKMQAIFEAMASLGIVDENIQTSNFSVNPRYARSNDRQTPPEVIGYQVSNTVRMTTTDMDALGTVLDRLVTIGANQINGIQFGFRDPTTLQNQAREKAVTDARAKAELFAKAAGVNLGDVLVIQEGGASVPMPIMRAEMAMMDSAVPIASGQQTITAQINVTYALK